MRSIAFAVFVVILAVGTVGVPAAAAQSQERDAALGGRMEVDPGEPGELYRALREVGFDDSGGLRVEGVRIERGPATFLLETGVWYPLKPVAGRTTGAVFLGRGRLLFVPPEGVERHQLTRFSESERDLDARFGSLYLRFTDETASQVRVAAAGRSGREAVDGTKDETARVLRASIRPPDEARKLHEEIPEHLLEKERLNLDGRLLADLVEGRRNLFYGWVETDEHDRLTFRRDPIEPDLFTLAQWSDRFDGMLDVWSAFGTGGERSARVVHHELDVTLEDDELVESRATLEVEAEVAGPESDAEHDPESAARSGRRAHGSAEPVAPGVRALRFDLHPLVEVREIRLLEVGEDGQPRGEPLFFARERVEDEEFDGAVTVVLPEALAPGERARIEFVCGGEIIEPVLRRSGHYGLKAPVLWYPALGFLERATYEATFRLDEEYRIFASGERVSDEVESGVRTVRFRQEIPVGFFAFTYGDMRTERIEIDGLPPITVFGEELGSVTGDQLRNVGIDVANSMLFFERVFGDYPFPYMYVTRIPYSHGQGFPGLLHLTAGTFGGEVAGISEWFRAHEVAHQWWGHVVGWESYRDQWLSEGFASYSGALYAAAYLRGTDILDRILNAWHNDVLRKGSLRATYGFTNFGLPTAALRYSKGSWAGPISVGRRLASSRSPIDYNILVYEKGGFVLHMLRMLLHDYPTGSDRAFWRMMRDFVERHRGGEASTADFRRVVERHVGQEMDWFFDQWVHGTAIPTYRYAWRTRRDDDGTLRLEIRVRQYVEPDVEFRMPVPVRIVFEEDESSVIRLPVDRPERTFSLRVPREPEEVEFNFGYAVLAEVDEEGW